MTPHTWYQLLALAGAIVVLIALVNSRLRLHPFAALLVVAVGTGLAVGEPAAKIAGSLQDGAGKTLGGVGLTLALGVMLGRLLADSGATDALAHAITARAGRRRLPWVMAAAAFVIGIPMFFEVGLIVLLPLIFSVARRLRSTDGAGASPYVMLGVPAIAALSALHGMLPPHPGPLVAVTGLHADMGLTFAVGLVCAIPTIILAGPVYARWIAPRLGDVEPDSAVLAQFAGEQGDDDALSQPSQGRRIPTGLALVSVLIPVLLMLGRTLATSTLAPKSELYKVMTFAGDPTIAMLAGFAFAFLLLMAARPGRGEQTRERLTDSLKSIASILLIIAGGGAFNQVLVDSGLGKAVTHAAQTMHINTLILGWLVALLLSTSTGSATVGIVSATGMIAPLVGTGGGLHASLAVIAIGAGSLGLNYVNHAGFWLVKESFGMSLGQATKTQTVVQTLVSVFGLGMVLVLSALA